jgi:MbtH protein
MAENDDPFDTYKVVINHEEQYSIWPEERDNPPGWNDVGKSGPKQECLDYIQEVWPVLTRADVLSWSRRSDLNR